MPIHCPLAIRGLSADEFEQRDYRVMGHSQESHLQRLLALTDLRAMQWINLNHTEIQFITLTRDGRGMGANE